MYIYITTSQRNPIIHNSPELLCILQQTSDKQTHFVITILCVARKKKTLQTSQHKIENFGLVQVSLKRAALKLLFACKQWELREERDCLLPFSLHNMDLSRISYPCLYQYQCPTKRSLPLCNHHLCSFNMQSGSQQVIIP